jgi:hypothetical protein
VFCSADNNSSLIVNSSKLTYLDISGNRIRYLDKSVFRKQGQLETLILSGNMLQSLGPDLFTDCTNLRSLYISGNNVSEISTSSFRGLEQLEHLDLSNNNIEELNPLVFHNTLTSSRRHNRQVSKLKHLNLAQNKIRSFDFESYFPMSGDVDPTTPKFQLEYLDISSNCLRFVDVESATSFQTQTHVNLTGNPWECECSGLGAWREERRRPTQLCALAKPGTEYGCKVLGRICPYIRAVASTERPDSDTRAVTSTEPPGSDNGSTSVGTDSITESAPCSRREEDKETSLVTTLFVVNGLLLVSTVAGGGFIVVQLLKKMRKVSRVPEYDDTYVPFTGIDTSVRLNSSTNSNTYVATTGHVYETIN